jgi:Lectin C-type domain
MRFFYSILMRRTLAALFIFGVTFASVSFSAWADSSRIDFNGHGYQRFDVNLTWTAAKAFCEVRGAHLATVTSQAENDFIDANFRPNNLWLGATDAASEGVWTWVTGEPWAFTKWGASEPNNYQALEHFLSISTLGAQFWNDARDDANAVYSVSINPLCEWEFPTAIVIPAASFTNGQNVAVGVAACGGGGYGASVLLTAPPCTGSPLGAADFVFNAPSAGAFRLFADYAAGESRPMRLKINGAQVTANGLADVTGCWTENCQQWVAQGAYILLAGQNTLRIERDGAFPHIRTFRFEPVDISCTSSAVATIEHVDLTAAMTAMNALNFGKFRQTFNVTCTTGRFGVIRLPGVALGAIVGSGTAYALVQSSCASTSVQSAISSPTAAQVSAVMAEKTNYSALLSDPLFSPLASWVCQ